MEAWNRARFKWLVIPGRAPWREPGIHFSEHPGGAMEGSRYARPGMTEQ